MRKINLLVYIFSLLSVIYPAGKHSGEYFTNKDNLSVGTVHHSIKNNSAKQKWTAVDSVVRNAIQDSAFPGAVLLV